MAFKKWKRKGFKNRKRWSPEEKMKYHSSRDVSPSKFNIRFGGTEHCYSSGFVDGFNFIDNSSAIRHEFGERSSKSYRIGNVRGRNAAHKSLK